MTYENTHAPQKRQDPDEKARDQEEQSHDEDEDGTAFSSLTLIPVVDMADHSDDVRYGVQRGDGVFTHRSDVQLVADRGACVC